MASKDNRRKLLIILLLLGTPLLYKGIRLVEVFLQTDSRARRTRANPAAISPYLDELKRGAAEAQRSGVHPFQKKILSMSDSELNEFMNDFSNRDEDLAYSEYGVDIITGLLQQKRIKMAKEWAWIYSPERMGEIGSATNTSNDDMGKYKLEKAELENILFASAGRIPSGEFNWVYESLRVGSNMRSFKQYLPLHKVAAADQGIHSYKLLKDLKLTKEQLDALNEHGLTALETTNDYLESVTPDPKVPANETLPAVLLALGATPDRRTPFESPEQPRVKGVGEVEGGKFFAVWDGPWKATEKYPIPIMMILPNQEADPAFLQKFSNLKLDGEHKVTAHFWIAGDEYGASFQVDGGPKKYIYCMRNGTDCRSAF